MIIISSTGGSGSSFVYRELKNHGWKVCLRPDSGSQKNYIDNYELWLQRTKGFFKPPKEKIPWDDMASYTIDKLKSHKKTMLLCMCWGGEGQLQEVEDVIYLVRDPLFAFNSYSGCGWRSEGGQNRIKMVGAKDHNDPVWIKSFLYNFSDWIAGAIFAYNAHIAGNGYIVRYHKFKSDWKNIPLDLPPVHKNFECKDTPDKLKKLSKVTQDLIVKETQKIWQKILNL